MNEQKLSPCHFCGGEAKAQTQTALFVREVGSKAEVGGGSWIECEDCGAQGPYCGGNTKEDAERGATELWNRAARAGKTITIPAALDLIEDARRAVLFRHGENPLAVLLVTDAVREIRERLRQVEGSGNHGQ